MEIQKPRSHSPKIHDNTEEDLILVPPSVLDNKLRDFEEYNRPHSSVSGDVALTITLIVAILTSTFNDLPYLKGMTIRGAFITAFIFMLVKMGRNLYKIWHANGSKREDIIRVLKIKRNLLIKIRINKFLCQQKNLIK